MDKEKQIIEDVEVEWTSSESSASGSEDEELVETIRRSRFEAEFNHNRSGAESSTVRQERDRPATISGADVLSIPPIARLTRTPRRLSAESFLQTSNLRSSLTEEDLSEIRGRFGFPNEVQLRLPLPNE